LCGLLCLPAWAAADPFAPRANVPPGMEESFLGESIRDAAIPPAPAVGVPAYPGAVVIRSFAVTAPPKDYTGLPVIELITDADYDKVVDFYRQALPTWGRAELMSAYYFAEHGNINFFKPEESHVGVHRLQSYFRESEREMLQHVLPGAKTLIKVFYRR